MDREVEAALVEFFNMLAFVDADDLNDEERSLLEAFGSIGQAYSFEEATLLTSDRGVVINLDNGKEVLLTIQTRERGW
jgi:hypothetical protein